MAKPRKMVKESQPWVKLLIAQANLQLEVIISYKGIIIYYFNSRKNLKGKK